MTCQLLTWAYRTRLLHFTLMILLMVVLEANAAVAPQDRVGGTVRASQNGETFHLPLMKSEISAEIAGDLALVTITQTFRNPTGQALNATYLFPLNRESAVHAMRMRIGDEIVTARIRKKVDARQDFEKAKHEGKAAALLEQHRPNMFTQEIANLMPGTDVVITLKYTQAVPRRDGAYELVMPLVVGPRFDPAKSPSAGKIAAKSTAPTTNAPDAPTPAYPPVFGLNIPETIDPDRVTIAVTLNAPIEIGDVSSRTHDIEVSRQDRQAKVTLSRGASIDNRDFVLRYTLFGEHLSSGMLLHRDEDHGYFSLLIEPPVHVAAADIRPRELVFVLDTSGSMSGAPMNASKAFMRHAINALRPSDQFRIIRFASFATEFSEAPVIASAENRRRAQRFVEGLTTGGRTDIPRAIQTAFGRKASDDPLRLVIFLSDGYIGNESEVLRLISERIGEARIYAVGVGNGVNRYLLEEMARFGRGFSRIVMPGPSMDFDIKVLARRLETPVLTDISVDWGTLNPDSISPHPIPDLFAGDSIRVQGRFDAKGTHRITVHGKVAGRKATLPVDVDLSLADRGNEAVRLVWARSRIADHMRMRAMPFERRASRMSDREIEAEVTSLGLSHSLVSEWTSFLAVSRKVVNTEPDTAQNAAVPLPQVAGVTERAYGNVATRQAHPGTDVARLKGGSTPEPPLLIGVGILLLAGLVGLFRRQRQA